MSGLLVAGTTSDAGKSVVTAGLCRWLAREGVKVAPFKAQNMSLNSTVTRDGAEVGRAQAMQAAAARVEPEAAMNPVLLKPGSATHSQVVLMGQPVGEVDGDGYGTWAERLRGPVLDAYADLASRFDVVVAEGAGSPAEINLRARDLSNMGLARALGLPVVLVGDIDRGGLFASVYGTLALLDAEDQALVAGFLVNKFRGSPGLLAPGLDMLHGLTGRPTYGVLPWLDGLSLDVEDSLGLEIARGDADGRDGTGPQGEEVLRVAVLRFPRLSNFTDLDALAAEPGVVVRFVTRPEEVYDADLVVLPGTRATVSDLAWMRTRGLDVPVVRRAAEGRPVLGLCGGYQMLAGTIEDDVEGRAGLVRGLGLLPASVRFGTDKVLGRPAGQAYGEQVEGYEIHHGVVALENGVGGDAVTNPEAFLDGCRVGSVWGTTWHGAFECDGFRRAFLREVARVTGRRFVPYESMSFAALRERRLDALGDLVAQHADTAALWRLIERGAPEGLPVIPPAGPGGRL
ncbi:MAG: cobyric acid synthase [Actinomycetes bacterium]